MCHETTVIFPCVRNIYQQPRASVTRLTLSGSVTDTGIYSRFSWNGLSLGPKISLLVNVKLLRVQGKYRSFTFLVSSKNKKEKSDRPDENVVQSILLHFFFFFFRKTIQNSKATVINVALGELQSFTWYSKVLILNQNTLYYRMYSFEATSHEHNGLRGDSDSVKNQVSTQSLDCIWLAHCAHEKEPFKWSDLP